MKKPRKRGRPARLSREAVLDVAVTQVQRTGLASLTMRALADELGVTPMALYRHIGPRSELLRAVAERALGTVVLPAETGVVEWLRQVALRVREVARRHPGVMDLLAQAGPAVPTALRLLDETVSRLHAEGVAWDEATDLHNAFFSWLAGTIRREDAWTLGGGAAAALAEAWRTADAMDLDEMPGLAAALPRMRTKSADQEFETSLEIMLRAVRYSIER